jgi:Tfp pilus assembly protein PilN
MKIFLNLLPPERKESLVNVFYAKTFLARLIIVAGLFLLADTVLGVYYFRSLQHDKNALAQAGANNTSAQEEYRAYQDTFETINQKTRSTDGYLTLHTSFSWLLAEIENALPGGVRIQKLVTKEYQVLLSGTADTREAFLQMEAALKQDSCFTQFNAPLSNLFTETNVSFQIDFMVKEECLRGREIHKE